MKLFKKIKSYVLSASKMDIIKIRSQLNEIKELIAMRNHNEVLIRNLRNPYQSDFSVQKEIIDILSLLRPFKVSGFSKIRLGSKHDGGYIQLDDFNDIKYALSLGIGDNMDWDVDIANRGIKVYQFDHTIDDPSLRHPNVKFEKKKVATENSPGCVSIGEILNNISNSRRTDTILKIDIEGDEWKIFENIEIETLNRIAIIICEFHNLSALQNEEFRKIAKQAFTKLNSVFSVFHTHGNNFEDIINIHNICLPNVIEVSFANRNIYTLIETDEIFPINIDSPNNKQNLDIILGSFKFK